MRDGHEIGLRGTDSEGRPIVCGRLGSSLTLLIPIALKQPRE